MRSRNRRTGLTLPNGIVTEYAYDAASRLTGLTYKLGGTPIGTLTYTYDAAGNRTVVGGTWARTGLPAALTSATYNAANQQTVFGGVTQTFDLNGNLTSDGTLTYTWDARNRLASLSGGATASFQYDPLGRRTSKTINSTQTGFLYAGLTPVQELNGTTPTANLLTGLGIDEYLTRTDTATTHTYLTEALGSTVALADNTGTVQASYTYEPFGATSTTGTPGGNPFDYTGRESDGTGLKYYRARYYHPGLQRFISEDPIGFGGGDPNLYAYVGNIPTVHNDPRGLFADILLDAGFIAYDLGRLVLGGRKDLAENLTALGLDVVGAAAPFATGLGPAYRLGRAAKSANAADALRRKLSALEHAQASAAKWRTLADGRVRFYGQEVAARQPGMTRGASLVTEYDPTRGGVRQWMESYGHDGRVLRVHPKMINGEIVHSRHFPPTAAELGR